MRAKSKLVSKQEKWKGKVFYNNEKFLTGKNSLVLLFVKHWRKCMSFNLLQEAYNTSNIYCNSLEVTDSLRIIFCEIKTSQMKVRNFSPFYFLQINVFWHCICSASCERFKENYKAIFLFGNI